MVYGNMCGGYVESPPPQEETELLDSRIRLHSNFLYTLPAVFDIGMLERLYQGSKPYPIYGEHLTHHQGHISVAIMTRTYKGFVLLQ